MTLKRCKECGGTVAITKSTDNYSRLRWVIIGHGMQPCRCGPVVKMQSGGFHTLAASETAYDMLIASWNKERGMLDGMDSH